MNKKIFPIDQKVFLPEKNITCTGIDLGTTYTLLATIDSLDVDFKKSNVIPVKFVSIPQKSPDEYISTIYDEKVASMIALVDGKHYVGNNLYYLKGRKGYEYKRNIFYHWKVEMGVEHFPVYPNAITDNLDMPYKVAGGILNYCRANFLRSSDAVLENTIITVPASFQANQRQDVLKACNIAKIEFSPTMLVDEPNAAFLGYFNRLEDQEKQEWANNVRNKNILVIDFGGGTLDLSILNVDFKNDTGISIANKAISRYNDLGGQDLDSLIAEEYLFPKLKQKYSYIENLNHADLKNSLLPQLAVYGEKLKIKISEALSLKAADKDIEEIDYKSITASVEGCVLEFKNNEYDLGSISINGETFKSLFIKIFRGKHYNFKLQDKSITTISHSISEIIEKSNLTFNMIDFVLYVGGSSFNPFLISLVKEKLKKTKSLESPEPDKLVAEGATVFSYFYYLHNVSLINPITSDTIGIVLKGNKFHPIIESGKQLPVNVILPEFKLQSNMNSEIVIPVCINGIDFPIGEIRVDLNAFYNMDSVVTIKASITTDKIFELKVYVDDDFVGDGNFDNPFSIGKVSKEELDVILVQRKLNNAKSKGNTKKEKEALHDLIWKQSDVGNISGVVEAAEDYISRFDDQDAGVWNMVYCGNIGMGKVKAAKKGLDKAIELEPDNSSLIYNNSLLIARISGDNEALQYLENQPTEIRNNKIVICKIVLLKKNCGIECTDEAKKIVDDYKDHPYNFSEFDKRALLPGVFKIAGEAYSYIDPKMDRYKDDENKYLDVSNRLKVND